MPDYVLETIVSTGYEKTIARVKDALAREGFGVLTEIDIRETLKEKLGVEFKRYVILGACHPPSAHEALTKEESIGVLLPCNVVVHEAEGGTAVKAVKPTLSLAVTGREDLCPLGERVEDKLRRVVEGL